MSPAGGAPGVTNGRVTRVTDGLSGVEDSIAHHLSRGVKLTSQNWAWSAQQNGLAQYDEDSYSYDPNFDYLTGTTYTDNVSPSSESWTYDAAGNRTDSVVDNLNRTTSIQGTATTCDIFGNRLTWGSNSYGWDCLNRMTSYSGTNGSASYSYRADGMRVAKSATIGGTATATTYAYDGQMGFEDTDVSGGTTTVTDYGLGARGIDWISKAGSIAFPCYDSHGNMVATIARSGSGYALSNQRSFDAWGAVRLGNGSGDPKGRYCAAIGHKQDDESSLVYMRARYYEPGTGRFISEDCSRMGTNFLVYACDDPVGCVDPDGKGTLSWACFIGAVLAELATYFAANPALLHVVSAGLLSLGLYDTITSAIEKKLMSQIIDAQVKQIILLENQIDNSLAGKAAQSSLAGPAVDACNAEAGEIEGEFIAEDIDAWEDDGGSL